LEQEQLLEREPPAGERLVLLAVGEVDRRERGGPVREVLLDAQRGGQRLHRGQHARAGLGHELAQLGRADALRRRVHRHQPDRVHRGTVEGLVLADPELPTPAQLAVQEHLGSLPQLARDPRLVEPDGDQRAALVEHARLDALAAAIAHRPHGHAAHRHGHGGLLAHAQLAHQAHAAAVAVRVREVLDQVAPGLDAEPLECLGAVDRLGQQARPRIGAHRRVVG
jgi:hypothetical protein